MFECWNPRCCRYAGGSYGTLGLSDTFDFEDKAWCNECGRQVQAAPHSSEILVALAMGEVLFLVVGLTLLAAH